MNELIKALKEQTNAEVHFDEIHRRIYSEDASIYEVLPIGVAIPKTLEDLRRCVRIASQYKIPIIARGAATGISGGCLGKGLILDTSKYLNNIIDIDYEKETATVECGVVQDVLNKALEQKGYRLGPDTSTGNRATIGGMLANNSAGAQSLIYGTMADHILEVELLLEGANILHLKEMTYQEIDELIKKDTKDAKIYRRILQIREKYKDEIKRNFPDIPRRVSGYNLLSLIKEDSINICQLIAGSEGTLGVVSKIKVKISKCPKKCALVVIHYNDLIQAFSSVEAILQFLPISLELIDDKIIEMGKKSLILKNRLDWLKTSTKAGFHKASFHKALLVAEIEADTSDELKEKVEKLQKAIDVPTTILFDEKSISSLWDLRKAGLVLLMAKRSYQQAVAFIEDISVPPSALKGFITEFLDTMKTHSFDSGIYGHAGSGCLHIRPYINLKSKKDLEKMQMIIEDVSSMVKKAGGAMSGEHGDGLVRSWLNEKMFGKDLYEAFKEIKKTFDPNNLMNPSKVVDGPPLLQNLRLDPETETREMDTFLDFSKDGGFDLAVDMCNGNGTCRKQTSVMCPSFQATLDEYDSTRARAQALRAYIHNRLDVQGDDLQPLVNILDLCLECKGCKTECPSQVDMAKMKSEMLYQHQSRRGVPLRSRLFGHIDKSLKLASRFSWIVLPLQNSIFFKWLLKKFGITERRELPEIAKETFSSWVKRHEALTKKQEVSSQKKLVVLFNDTYSQFIEPKVAISAFTVLNALDFEVIVPDRACCARPLFSKGMLKEAKESVIPLCDRLLELAKRGLDIIVLEPSCLSMIKDDWPALLKEKDLSVLQQKVVSFEEFLVKELKQEQIDSLFIEDPLNIALHTHCHQKSLYSSKSSVKALKMLGGCQVSEISSGCCGMAGSFGYEKEHYDLSIKIAHLSLVPQIHLYEKTHKICASGFSCRSQIYHTTKTRAMHIAELFAERLIKKKAIKTTTALS